MRCAEQGAVRATASEAGQTQPEAKCYEARFRGARYRTPDVSCEEKKRYLHFRAVIFIFMCIFGSKMQHVGVRVGGRVLRYPRFENSHKFFPDLRVRAQRPKIDLKVALFFQNHNAVVRTLRLPL